MEFELPRKYKGFTRKRVGLVDALADVYMWEEYKNGNITIHVQRFQNHFQVTGSIDLIKSQGHLKKLSECYTLEEAWSFMKGWIEQNALRGELQGK